MGIFSPLSTKLNLRRRFWGHAGSIAWRGKLGQIEEGETPLRGGGEKRRRGRENAENKFFLLYMKHGETIKKTTVGEGGDKKKQRKVSSPLHTRRQIKKGGTGEKKGATGVGLSPSHLPSY